jgi:hypothetical protein
VIPNFGAYFSSLNYAARQSVQFTELAETVARLTPQARFTELAETVARLTPPAYLTDIYAKLSVEPMACQQLMHQLVQGTGAFRLYIKTLVRQSPFVR